MKKMARKTVKFLFLFCVGTFLCGCAAAPMAVMPLMTVGDTAFTSFTIFKSVQIETGASVTVSFKDKKVGSDIQSTMNRCKQLVVWPGDDAAVYVADKLQKSHEFRKILTPSRVSKILDKLNLEESTIEMTEKDMLENFEKVCRKTHADILVALKFMGIKEHTSSFSFHKPYTERLREIYVYDHHQHKVVYDGIVMVKVEITEKMVNEMEVWKITGQTIAEKIIQLKTGKAGEKPGGKGNAQGSNAGTKKNEQ